MKNLYLNNKHLFKVSFFVVLTLLSWSSAFVAIRIGLAAYHPGPLALFRYLIASVLIIFLYLSLPSHLKPRPNLKEGAYIFLSGVLGFAVYTVTLNYGEITVPSGIASFIIAQMPVAVALMSSLFLHEKITPLLWLGIAVSVAGVGLIAYSYQGGDLGWDIGILYLLIATLVTGIYSVMYKSFAKKFHPIQLTAYAIWAGTIAMLIYLPQLIQEVQASTTYATWVAVYLGVVPSFIGYISWGFMLNYLPATKASGFLYAMPILATILGWVILSEVPAFLALIGGLVALCGAVMINSAKCRN